VIAIQCTNRVESILPQIKKLGSLVQSVIGTQGEAAVVAFDGRIRVMQDFTTDPDKIKVGIEKINAGTSGSRMIDAVDRGVYMLRRRPPTNRRIVLLVSETRDEGSEMRLREALIDANLTNVLVYTVDITQFAVRLTEKQPDPGPTRRDPAAMNAPMGIPNTPTTADVNYGMGNRAQFVPVLKEIYTDAKAIFVKDPAKQFTQQTGGEQFYFIRQKGLEEAVQRVSQEIHSQYLISYRPSNAEEGGYHTISVSIDRSDLRCKTRPGYWIGGGKAQESPLRVHRVLRHGEGRTHRSREMTLPGPRKPPTERFRQLWPDIRELVRPRRNLLALGFFLIIVSRVAGLALPLSSRYHR